MYTCGLLRRVAYCGSIAGELVTRHVRHLLRTAHLGKVSVTVWSKILKDMCRERNIHVLE